MRDILSAIVFLTLGILVGIGLLTFLTTEGGRSLLGASIALLVGVGLCVAVVTVITKIWVTKNSQTWVQNNADAFIASATDAAKDPSKIPDLLEENKAGFLKALQLGAAVFVANRSLVYTAMALTGVVSVATLLTAYVQIERMEQQNSLVEASRRASLVFELTAILDKLPNEPIEELTPLLLARAASLTRALKPYRILENETLSDPTSPERGQLLTTLAATGVDISQLTEAGALFDYADLRDTVFDGTNLNNANLESADLRGAVFKNVQWEQTVLKNAKLPDPGSVRLPMIRTATQADDEAFDAMNIFSAEISDAIVYSKSWWQDWIGLSFPESDLKEISEIHRSSNEVVFFLSKTRQPEGNTDVQFRIGIDSDVDKVLTYTSHTGKIQPNATHVNNWFNSHPVDHFLGGIVETQMTVGFSLYGSEMTSEELAIAQKQFDSSVAPGLIKQALAPKHVKISPDVFVFGHPSSTRLFRMFVDRNVNYPDRADFKAISPGGIDPHSESEKTSVLDLGDNTLRHADLRFSDLRFVDFSRTDLTGADLRSTALPEWKLMNPSTLENVKLDGAIAPASWAEAAKSLVSYKVVLNESDYPGLEETWVTFEPLP